MKELNREKASVVNGGRFMMAPWGGAIMTYLAIVDLAWEFGEGLGSGFYDGRFEQYESR